MTRILKRVSSFHAAFLVFAVLGTALPAAAQWLRCLTGRSRASGSSRVRLLGSGAIACVGGDARGEKPENARTTI